MKIKVIYLARLSEDLGKKEEILELPDSGLTIKDIFLKLNLDKFEYKIFTASNFEHTNFEYVLRENDEIAFFPTITGG